MLKKLQCTNPNNKFNQSLHISHLFSPILPPHISRSYGLPRGDWCPSVWHEPVSACSLLEGAAYSHFQLGLTLSFASVPAFSPPLLPLLSDGARPRRVCQRKRSCALPSRLFMAQQLFSQERFPIQYLLTAALDVPPFSLPSPILHSFPPCTFIILCLPMCLSPVHSDRSFTSCLQLPVQYFLCRTGRRERVSWCLLHYTTLYTVHTTLLV